MKEEDIRKRELFNEYLALVREDAKCFFGSMLSVKSDCPACGSNNLEEKFKKMGFDYVACCDCDTLFVNPKPPFSILKKFYSQSVSTSFWVNKFFKPVMEARRKKIFVPRAKYANDILAQKSHLCVADIGAGFGLFLQELRKIAPANQYLAIEPSLDMAGFCRDAGLDVKCICLEEIKDMNGSFDFLSAFELMEHLYDPYNFLRKVYDLLKPGGCFLLTTLNGMGFDILVLGERSKSIIPPHHLNFFNPVSIRILMQKAGFDILEVTTPGKLDWDIVEGMIKKEGFDAGSFWNSLARSNSASAKDSLQRWIADNSFSSHMRVLVRKG